MINDSFNCSQLNLVRNGEVFLFNIWGSFIRLPFPIFFAKAFPKQKKDFHSSRAADLLSNQLWVIISNYINFEP